MLLMFSTARMLSVLLEMFIGVIMTAGTPLFRIKTNEDETEKTQRIAEEVGRMLTSLGIGFVGFDAGRGSTGGHGDADGHF
jgi:hypothetical protein